MKTKYDCDLTRDLIYFHIRESGKVTTTELALVFPYISRKLLEYHISILQKFGDITKSGRKASKFMTYSPSMLTYVPNEVKRKDGYKTYYLY